jgi:hypothetical protein
MTAWTSPRTWVAGETVGAANMNTHIRDNENAIWENISGAGWTSFTPSWTNLTVGSGTNVGYYGMAGKTVLLHVEFTYGSGSAVGTDPYFVLPQTGVTYSLFHRIGYTTLYDASGSVYEAALVYLASTLGQIKMNLVSGSYVVLASVSATAPFTWTTGDKILISGFYERA